MIKVQLTANLQKYYPQARFEIEAATVLDLLKNMDKTATGFSGYILEDDRSVRTHVNIFVDGQLLPKKDTSRPLKPGQTVHIMQALSGG
jgi:molybdopterin synthase sulfur carrier subunit